MFGRLKDLGAGCHALRRMPEGLPLCHRLGCDRHVLALKVNEMPQRSLRHASSLPLA